LRLADPIHRFLRGGGSKLGDYRFAKVSITTALQRDIKRHDMANIRRFQWYELGVKNIARVAVSAFIISTGLGFVGLGAASVAQAQPGPFPQWCPGDFWDQGWGGNPDGFHCHDGGPGFGGHDDRGGWGHDDGRGRR